MLRDLHTNYQKSNLEKASVINSICCSDYTHLVYVYIIASSQIFMFQAQANHQLLRKFTINSSKICWAAQNRSRVEVVSRGFINELDEKCFGWDCKYICCA